MNTGLVAIIIILVVIVGAIATRRCMEFLIGGSIVAALVLYGGDFLTQWCTMLQTTLADNVWIFLVCGLFGSLIAPRSSARSATYFRAVGLSLSIVPLLVTIATIPPGLTLSTLFARK